MSDEQLYVVYMYTGVLFFQTFKPRKRANQNPARDANLCPEGAYGFYYATAPKGVRVQRIAQLKITSGLHHVDAILVPTSRLRDYVEATGIHSDVDEMIRNGNGAPYQAHTRCGRFFPFKLGKDVILSNTNRQQDSPEEVSSEAAVV